MRPERRLKPGMDGGLRAAVLVNPPLHLRTLKILSKRWGPPHLGTLYPRLDTDVHLVFDLSEQYSEKCVSLFHKLRRTKAEVKKRCLGLAFADDEVHAGLQIADMIAYCSRADAMRSIRTPVPIVEELISLFNSQDIEVGAVSYRLGGMGLGHGELEIGSGKNGGTQ